MNLRVSAKVRLATLGSALLVLSVLGWTGAHAVTASLPPPHVGLFPTQPLLYQLANGESTVKATVALGNGCMSLSSWGTVARTGNNFSATVKVVDVQGPMDFCILSYQEVQFAYGLGVLSAGSYRFMLTGCSTFPNYGAAVDCSNTTSISFQVGAGAGDDGTILFYQNINGESFVNATVVVHPCYRLRGWSDPSQSANNFDSNVTLVDDTRLMIACIAIDTSASHSYVLGNLAPGLYSFALNVCNIIIGWGPGPIQVNNSTVLNLNTTVNCTAHTLWFQVPGIIVSQPPPTVERFRVFGPFAILIIFILRLLGILTG